MMITHLRRPPQRREPVQLAPRQQRYLRLRRGAECVLAGGALLVAAAPMGLAALGVLLTMGRPVLFQQQRVTQGGRLFELQKFRSMREPDGSGRDDDASRLVPFGRFLRATSLDELPSLWNIMKGDMSFVGPRPLTTDYLGRFSAEQFTRHAVPAGLTGLAQVNGRNSVTWDERLRLDQDYVRRLGPALDLRIMAATVLTVLRRGGVTDSGGVSMSDFPGPQSTTRLELHGFTAEGAWECRSREGVTVLAGRMTLLEDAAVEVEFSTMPRGRASSAARAPGPAELDEVLLLLLSRLRHLHDTEWVRITDSALLHDDLRAALIRAGLIHGDGRQEAAAFIGLAEDEAAAPLIIASAEESALS